MNYYNEFDPFASKWLKQLIVDGLIPLGDVDDRSIEDIKSTDLAGYAQCHFFAGIGGWSRALELAQWDSNRPVWTGSPPCQSFSVAGKGKGKDDSRHLWPVFFNLIRECQPSTVFGEQVAAAIRHGWLDDLQNDFEKEGYASAAVVLPSGSIGAYHKRDRLFFTAKFVADTIDQRSQRRLQGRSDSQRQVIGGHVRRSCSTLWSGSTLIHCRDGKHRPIPVESALFPLADGVSNRVGILRGAGNAIVPQAAAEIIKAVM